MSFFVSLNYFLNFRYARYHDQLAKTKAFNREKDQDFVAEVTEIAPGEVKQCEHTDKVATLIPDKNS